MPENNYEQDLREHVNPGLSIDNLQPLSLAWTNGNDVLRFSTWLTLG